MSVFTKVSHVELHEFLRQYPLGEVLGFQGIGEGVENTNYYLDTADGRWVLTLFERLDPDDLPFFLGLMEHLARRGVPSPEPLHALDGRALTALNGKPACIVNRLAGGSVLFPSVEQCRAAGEVLAEMHLAGRSFPMSARNARGVAWRRATGEHLLAHVDAETGRIIRDELDADARLPWAALPQGVIHADLFRDNVLFAGDRVGGVIDFYYACNDALLYDLAITVNDWCFETDGTPNAARWRALVTAYAGRRGLTAQETGAWGAVLRSAALRFWLSRLHDWHFPRAGDLVHVKDPEAYGRILRYYRAGGILPA